MCCWCVFASLIPVGPLERRFLLTSTVEICVGKSIQSNNKGTPLFCLVVRFNNFVSWSLALCLLRSFFPPVPSAPFLYPSTRGPWQGPWGCILLDGSYSLQDYSAHHVPLNQAAQKDLGRQEHPADQQHLGVPFYHSLGGLEHLEEERKYHCYCPGTYYLVLPKKDILKRISQKTFFAFLPTIR